MKWDTRALRFLVAIPGETPLTQMVARPISARAAHAESVNAPSAETFAPRSVSLNFKPTSAPQHKHLSSGCLNVSCRHRHNASSHPKRIRTFCPLRLGPGIPVWTSAAVSQRPEKTPARSGKIRNGHLQNGPLRGTPLLQSIGFIKPRSAECGTPRAIFHWSFYGSLEPPLRIP